MPMSRSPQAVATAVCLALGGTALLTWAFSVFTEDKSKRRPGSLPKSGAQLATPETLNGDAPGGNSPTTGERSIASVIVAEQLAGQGQEGPELVIKNAGVVEPTLDQGKQQYPLYKEEGRLPANPLPISEETIAVGQPVNFFQNVPPIDDSYNGLLRKTPITDAVVLEGIGVVSGEDKVDPTEKRVSQLDNKVTTYEERKPATELMQDGELIAGGTIPMSVSSKSLERAVMFAPPSKNNKPKTGSFSGVENSIAELHVEGVTEEIMPLSMEETQSMSYSRSASFSSEHSKVLSLPPTSNRSLIDGTGSNTNSPTASRASRDGEGPLETSSQTNPSNDLADGTEKNINSPNASRTSKDGEGPLETSSQTNPSNGLADGTERNINSPNASRTTKDGEGPLETSSQTDLFSGAFAKMADPNDKLSNQLKRGVIFGSGELEAVMDVPRSGDSGDQQRLDSGSCKLDARLGDSPDENASADNPDSVDGNVEPSVMAATNVKPTELTTLDREYSAQEAVIAPTQSMNVSSAIDVPADTKVSKFYAPVRMERELTPDSLIMDISASASDPAMRARSTSLERSEMRFQIGVDKRVSSASDSGSPTLSRSCDSPSMKADVFGMPEGEIQSPSGSMKRSEYYAPPRIERQLTPDLSVHSSSVTHRSNSSSLERSEMHFQINSPKESSRSADGVLSITLDGQTADALDDVELTTDMAKSSTTTTATEQSNSTRQQTLVKPNESDVVMSTAQEFHSAGSAGKDVDGEGGGLASISLQVAISPGETRESGLGAGDRAMIETNSVVEVTNADPKQVEAEVGSTEAKIKSSSAIEKSNADPKMAEIEIDLSTGKSEDDLVLETDKPNISDTEERSSGVSNNNAPLHSKLVMPEDQLDSHEMGADNSNFEGSVASSPAADETCSLSSDGVESSRRQMTETEEVVETSVEETVTMVITGVVANPGADEERILSMQDAVSQHLLDLQNGLYHNQITGEKMSMIDAMNSGFIKMGPKKVEKSQEKIKSVGIVTIKTLRETTPYTVKSAMDTRNGQMYHVFQATRRKILDSAKGTFTDLKTGSKMLIGDAVDLGLVEVEYDAMSAELMQEEITKTYSVHAVVDQKAKVKVAFHEAVSRGLIDLDTGEYIHNTEGTRIPIEEAISKGFIKAVRAESAEDISVDKMGSSVAERGVDVIRKKVMNPINVLHQMKH